MVEGVKFRGLKIFAFRGTTVTRNFASKKEEKNPCTEKVQCIIDAYATLRRVLEIKYFRVDLNFPLFGKKK